MLKNPGMIIVLVVLALVVVVCKAKSGTESDGAVVALDQGRKAALVLDGPIDDGGWNADCYAGMLQARDELGFSISVSENLAAADFVSAFREYAAEGYDLIVAPGNQFQDAVEQIYEEFPNSHFAGINFSYSAKNVTSMGFNNVQAGFLAGALAGLFTKTGSCGYIGGTEIQPTTDSSQGMKMGIEYVNKNVKFVSSMTGSWDDVAKGRELGISQITTANVDVIFSFAGACNTGIIEAAKEKNTWVIVEPMDILDTDPGAICGSVLMSNGALIMFAANVVVKGESGQAMIGDISNDVIGLGRLNDVVGADIRSALDTITKDLADGKIKL